MLRIFVSRLAIPSRSSTGTLCFCAAASKNGIHPLVTAFCHCVSSCASVQLAIKGPLLYHAAIQAGQRAPVGSTHTKAPLIQPVSDLVGQRHGVSNVIANWFNVSAFKARVKSLQHFVIANRALSSRRCALYANMQTGPQKDKIERDLLQNLASRINVIRR